MGLVRMLDARRWRHFYAVGEIPAGGALVGELGSLHATALPGTDPVWLIDGQIVSGHSRRLASPLGRLATVRWALAPAAWGDFPETAWRRWRTVLSRLTRIPSRVRAGGTDRTTPDGRPVGWVARQDGPFSRALWAGVHPVTGDQLLTANRWEAIDLGYKEVALVGFMRWETPLTGSPETTRPRLPWASRLGQRVRTDAGPPEYEARGQIDQPAGAIAMPWRMRGWALVPGTSIASVELLVGEESSGRARIGIQRPEIAAATRHPDAPMCGWEHTIMPGDVASDTAVTSAVATLHTVDGRRFWLGPVPISLAAPAAEVPQHRPAQLRQRARSMIGRPAPRRPGRPRVLVFTHSLQLGGAQLYLADLLTRLAERWGHAFTVVAPEDGPQRDSLEALGIPVHITHFYPVATVETYEAKLAELAAWAAPQGFDIVLVNTVVAFCGVEVAELLGVPSVFAIHESFDLDALWVETFPGLVDPHVKHRARETLSLASAILFEAEATRRQYLSYGASERMLTVPYAIELDRIDRFRAASECTPTRRALGLPVEATVVLALGTIEPRKAQACLVQALGSIVERHPSSLLVLVGEVETPWCIPYAAGLRDMIGRAGLRDRVWIRPIDPDPYRWHAVADLLVCASDVESLPRVLLEAMAFDTQVLATNVFGVPELIEDGRTGWLCEPRDLRSLTGALNRVLSTDPEVCRRVGRAGGRAVRERHAPQAYAARVAALLEGLIADPRADSQALLELAPTAGPDGAAGDLGTTTVLG